MLEQPPTADSVNKSSASVLFRCTAFAALYASLATRSATSFSTQAGQLWASAILYNCS